MVSIGVATWDLEHSLSSAYFRVRSGEEAARFRGWECIRWRSDELYEREMARAMKGAMAGNGKHGTECGEMLLSVCVEATVTAGVCFLLGMQSGAMAWMSGQGRWDMRIAMRAKKCLPLS